MELHVFLAVLAAAAMHASWNAFLKLRIEPFLAMTLVTVGSGIVALPGLLVFGVPIGRAWPWLIASVIIHLGYYVTLSEAYRRADMSQIYPIARGGAPLLTATVATFILRETIAPSQVAGILALTGGIGLMSVFGRRRGTRADPVAITFAVATAALISAYTVVDGLGARAAGDANAYSSTLFVVEAIPLVLVALKRRGSATIFALRRNWVQGLVGGGLSLGSYWIAIWAMTVAPIALVAALRESSVLWAVMIAVVFLKEPLQWPRAALAVAILASLILIRVG